MKTRARKVLSDILETGIDVHRCAAARAFATIGGPDSVALLIKALLDEDPDVRTDAAQALEEIGDPDAATQLMENLLGDPETDVKKAALTALINFGHEPVAPLLRKLAVSRTDEIIWDEEEFYTDGWDGWLDLQLIAIRGLATFGDEDAVTDVLTAMGDEMGQDVSEVGVAALADLGLTGAVALEQLFPLSDARLQRRIAQVVVRSDNPHVQPQIDTLLAAPLARVRETTVLGMASTDARLEPLFGDPDSIVRAAVVRRAGAHFPEQVADLIPDADPVVRAEVFKVIAADPDAYRDEQLIEAVKKAISGEPKAAKQAALALIALKGSDAFKGLAHVMTNKKVPLEFRVGAIEALETAGPVAASHLMKAAADDERQMRLAAMTALAGLAANDPIWPNVAGEGLLVALDGDLIKVPEVPEAPEEGEEPEAKEEVQELAENPEDVIEAEQEVDETTPLMMVPNAPAGSTLDNILTGGADDTDATGGSVDSAEPAPEPIELSEQDLRFLELSKQKKMSKRKMSLESDVAPHLDVRRFAASVLGGVPNPEVTVRLIAVLADKDSDLKDEALNSLVQHGDTLGVLPSSAQEPLLDLFASDTSDSTRVLALRALGKLSGDAVAEVLLGALKDADPLIRVEAVHALDNQGIAGPEVEAVLGDSYMGVGIAAARSLARNRGDDAVDALIEFGFKNDGTYRRDLGKLLGTYAPETGIRRLIDVLGDDTRQREKLVAIDALAEAIARIAQNQDLKVA